MRATEFCLHAQIQMNQLHTNTQDCKAAAAAAAAAIAASKKLLNLHLHLHPYPHHVSLSFCLNGETEKKVVSVVSRWMCQSSQFPPPLRLQQIVLQHAG